MHQFRFWYDGDSLRVELMLFEAKEAVVSAR